MKLVPIALADAKAFVALHPQAVCDQCRDLQHGECVERTFPYDHEGVDVRVCFCRCTDVLYHQVVASQDEGES